MALRSLLASKNLDVPETSRDSIFQALKDRRVIWRLSRSYLLCAPIQHTMKSSNAAIVLHGSKHLSFGLATNLIEAVDHARSIGFPLVAHATIHWSGTVAFDDPDGKLF